MKQTILLAFSIVAAALFADTITWTGGAGTLDYGTGGNWDADHVPGNNDNVIIDSAAVTWNDTHYVPAVLTLQNGASLAIGNEIQFNTINPKIYGGTVTGEGLIAAQAADAVLTISDAHLKCSSDRTDFFVFYQQGASYLNFEDGSSRSASLSYLESLNISDPYATFFSGNTPKIRYNGELVSQADFSENFQVATANGYVTISLKSRDGWAVAAPTLGEVANGEVPVTYTATKYSGGNATIVIGCASSDLGADIANWAGKTTEAATDVADTTTYSTTITLGVGINYIRVFVTADGTTIASPAVTARNIVYADYGTLTDVYEYIGTDNDLTKASNWVKDGKATATAPTAGTDIRWFGYNAALSINGFSAYSTDHFVGANITSSSDFDVYSDLVFSNSTITATMFVMKEETHQFEIAGSTMVQTRTDAGWYGIYFGADYAAFNFVSGQAASFTGKAPNGITTDNLYSQHVANNKYILLDGAAIDAETWDTHFNVEMLDNGQVKVTYNPVAADKPKIGEVEYSVTSEKTITVSANVVSKGADENAAFAYLVWDVEDKGSHRMAWANSVTLSENAATGSTLNGSIVVAENGFWHFRVILENGEDSNASTDQRVFVKYYDGESGTINEWVGGAGDMNDAANWSLGHVPADGEIRWFDSTTAIDMGAADFIVRPNDHFMGGSITTKGELHTRIEDGTEFSATFAGTAITCSLVSSQSGSYRYTFSGGSLTTTHSDYIVYAGNGVKIVVPEGSTATFNFPATEETAYVMMHRAFIYANSESTLTQEEFTDHFSCEEVEPGIIKVYLTPTDDPIGPCGLTAEQAEIAGIDYYGTTQFAIQSTTFDGTKVALTFPGKWAASSYTVQYSTTPDGKMTDCTVVSSKGDESESYEKTNTVTVQLPTDANVVFFHVTRTAE